MDDHLALNMISCCNNRISGLYDRIIRLEKENARLALLASLNSQDAEKGNRACPFCHRHDRLEEFEAADGRDSGTGFEYSIGCLHCKCSGPAASSPQEAWDLWNGRKG